MYQKKIDLSELILVRTISNMPEYIRLGKELATLIRELNLHNIELKKGESWQIKGTVYQIQECIVEVNYQLISGNNSDIVWLSELLPLSVEDFKHLSD